MKIKPIKRIPFDFVLEALERLHPTTRAMFGCTAVYVEQKFMLILRDKEDYPDDNGIWLGTALEHHESLRKEFPALRSLGLFGIDKPTAWQNLPASSDTFESDALRACELILKGDPRIGKIPKAKSKRRKPKDSAKIKSLQNLGPYTQELLNKVKIKDYAGLKKIGWKKAAHLLSQETKKPANLNLLYAIYAMLKDKDWRALNLNQKLEIKNYRDKIKIKTSRQA